MSSPELGSTLYNLHSELAANMADPPYLSRPLYSEVLPGNLGSEDLLASTFSYASRLAFEQRNTEAPPPRFKFTRHMLELALRLGTASMPDEAIARDLGCPRAELHFASSLAWHDRRQTDEDRASSQNHRSAAIHFNTEDRPFAYEKASGLTTAFVWRSSYYRSQAGLRWLPASSIVHFVYDAKSEAASHGLGTKYPGKGLLDLRDATPALDVQFVRLGASLLPKIIREALLDQGIKARANLAPHRETARKITGRRVAWHVRRLMLQGKAVSIGSAAEL